MDVYRRDIRNYGDMFFQNTHTVSPKGKGWQTSVTTVGFERPAKVPTGIAYRIVIESDVRFLESGTDIHRIFMGSSMISTGFSMRSPMISSMNLMMTVMKIMGRCPDGNFFRRKDVHFCRTEGYEKREAVSRLPFWTSQASALHSAEVCSLFSSFAACIWFHSSSKYQ